MTTKTKTCPLCRKTVEIETTGWKGGGEPLVETFAPHSWRLMDGTRKTWANACRVSGATMDRAEEMKAQAEGRRSETLPRCDAQDREGAETCGEPMGHEGACSSEAS